jgi:hypothetical protein
MREVMIVVGVAHRVVARAGATGAAVGGGGVGMVVARACDMGGTTMTGGSSIKS